MKVDFYILSADVAEQHFICRLLEKAYLQGRTVFVLCADQTMAETLDELLWTFREDSFVPHNLQGEGPTAPPPIQFGFAAAPVGFNDILLNLTATVPPYFKRFQRIIEMVANAEDAKTLSRQHYQFYRQQGFNISTHHIEK